MKTIASRINERLATCYPHSEIKALTRIIATELLGIPQMAYYLNEDITLGTVENELLNNAITRLRKQEPIQHILGYEEFCGIRFKVNCNVLIPRPETQELVEWVASEAPTDARILDIGTGSGCIAISLAKRLPHSLVAAWDISQEALLVAKENNSLNATNVEFTQVDILSHRPTQQSFDIIVSNPPYIKEEEKENIQPNVLDWEPHTALFVPDNDPLLFYRTIAQKALTMLTPGGKLFFEINRAHGKETCAMLSQMGYTQIELRKDFADNDRMIRAVKE